MVFFSANDYSELQMKVVSIRVQRGDDGGHTTLDDGDVTLAFTETFLLGIPAPSLFTHI